MLARRSMPLLGANPAERPKYRKDRGKRRLSCRIGGTCRLGLGSIFMGADLKWSADAGPHGRRQVEFSRMSRITIRFLAFVLAAVPGAAFGQQGEVQRTEALLRRLDSNHNGTLEITEIPIQY